MQNAVTWKPGLVYTECCYLETRTGLCRMLLLGNPDWSMQNAVTWKPGLVYAECCYLETWTGLCRMLLLGNLDWSMQNVVTWKPGLVYEARTGLCRMLLLRSLDWSMQNAVTWKPGLVYAECCYLETWTGICRTLLLGNPDWYMQLCRSTYFGLQCLLGLMELLHLQVSLCQLGLHGRHLGDVGSLLSHQLLNLVLVFLDTCLQIGLLTGQFGNTGVKLQCVCVCVCVCGSSCGSSLIAEYIFAR